jgi:hypothetical protein
MNWTGAKMDGGVACRLAAALSFAVNESGAISTKTVVLLDPGGSRCCSKQEGQIPRAWPLVGEADALPSTHLCQPQSL